MIESNETSCLQMYDVVIILLLAYYYLIFFFIEIQEEKR